MVSLILRTAAALLSAMYPFSPLTQLLQQGVRRGLCRSDAGRDSHPFVCRPAYRKSLGTAKPVPDLSHSGPVTDVVLREALLPASNHVGCWPAR